jgi:hypothetical protein
VKDSDSGLNKFKLITLVTLQHDGCCGPDRRCSLGLLMKVSCGLRKQSDNVFGSGKRNDLMDVSRIYLVGRQITSEATSSVRNAVAIGEGFNHGETMKICLCPTSLA